MTEWFTRPVLHVTNVDAAIRFYEHQLGFAVPWRHQEDGRTRVAQVERQSCALILSDQWPKKVGTGLLFVSLNVEPDTRDEKRLALDGLRSDLEHRGIRVTEGFWGYRVLIIDDPDGNQLFFNYPNDGAAGNEER